MKKICPRCGKERIDPFGISRMDQLNICSICCSKEALDLAVKKGNFCFVCIRRNGHAAKDRKSNRPGFFHERVICR